LTLLDLAAVLIVVGYVALGWFTGTIRRVIGLVAVYLALLVATYMGQQGADVVMQSQTSMPVPDARLVAWTFFLVLMLLVFEGAATAVHTQLQLAVVALNRGVGVVLGLVTSVVLITALIYMLAGFAKPSARQPDQLQITIRDAVVNSGIAYPLARATAAYVLPFLNAALPRDSQAYFVLEGTR
jgi:uncharacterized membrane protein required for colicin V production